MAAAYQPGQKAPFVLSRSKLDLFTECARCAFLDLRLGVKRVSGPSFTLNNAVDELLKREFDLHRAQGSAHPLCAAYGVNAVPFADERLEAWRDALRRGIAYHHPATNLTLRGGIDDVWKDAASGELIIVDYKATAKKVAPASEEHLYDSYKRQIEIYQWLFRQNGFAVSPTAYFVYVNGKSDARAFDAKLEFEVNLIPYAGSDAWVEPKLYELKEMLESAEIPPIGTNFDASKPCDYCTYRENAGRALRKAHASGRQGGGQRD
jgi:hypothetical protein